MSSAGQLNELLLRWEEEREQGRVVSPEELCRDCPHLVEEVRREIQGLERLYEQLAQTSTEEPLPATSAPPRLPNFPGYELLEELGRGGMGIVYKARQQRLNRVVALKTIRAGSDADEQQLARFKAEAAAVARLQHPN